MWPHQWILTSRMWTEGVCAFFRLAPSPTLPSLILEDLKEVHRWKGPASLNDYMGYPLNGPSAGLWCKQKTIFTRLSQWDITIVILISSLYPSNTEPSKKPFFSTTVNGHGESEIWKQQSACLLHPCSISVKRCILLMREQLSNIYQIYCEVVNSEISLLGTYSKKIILDEQRCSY